MIFFSLFCLQAPNANETNNSAHVHGDSDSEPGKYVVQSIVDSQVTGFLTKVRRDLASHQ